MKQYTVHVFKEINKTCFKGSIVFQVDNTDWRISDFLVVQKSKYCNNLTPDAMSAIIKNNDNIKRYQLRKKLKIDVPRFNTNYMRNSVARRGAIVWNTLVPRLNDDIDNVKKYAIMARRSKTLLHLNFDCISPQTLTRWEEDFKYN